jgi:ABC-type methionine transport system ATPase subunit
LESESAAPDEPLVSRTLRLGYPASLVREPILHRLIRQFDLTVNILSAQLGIDEGWLELRATGPSAELERAIAWLTAEGLQVSLPD